MALERIEANDFAGARRWLDWARLELRAVEHRGSARGTGVRARLDRRRGGGHDAARAGDGDVAGRLPARRARAAAAARPRVPRVTDAADEAQSRSRARARRTWNSSDWTALAEVGARLSAAVPTLGARVPLSAMGAHPAAASGMRWTSASRERLARLPDDSIAREMLVHRAEARGEFGEMPGDHAAAHRQRARQASDYNQYAWTALLTQPVSEQAVEAARMAYDETQGRNFAVAHTLACVYAATGKPREARDLLLKGMEQVGIDKPDDSAWYGFGLVAEAYGDVESARDYYAHVQKPKKGMVQASSVYALSQARLDGAGDRRSG